MEQLFLGRRIGRHRAVIFEVVARQVGEYRYVEGRAIDATLIEPMEETSIAHASAPRATKPASAACRVMASGVVLGLSSSASRKPLPSVPTTAHRCRNEFIAWAIHCVTEVLPLVPVTPASHNCSEGRP